MLDTFTTQTTKTVYLLLITHITTYIFILYKNTYTESHLGVTCIERMATPDTMIHIYMIRTTKHITNDVKKMSVGGSQHSLLYLRTMFSIIKLLRNFTNEHGNKINAILEALITY